MSDGIRRNKYRKNRIALFALFALWSAKVQKVQKVQSKILIRIWHIIILLPESKTLPVH